MQYEFILREIKNMVEGGIPANYNVLLNKIALSLEQEYNVKPVDVVAAQCLISERKIDYARVLLSRAYKDLVRIGKEMGWIL